MTETPPAEIPLAPGDVEAIADARTPGERLARARVANGLSIEAIAQQLKFSPRQIEALEGDRYDALPGATMVRGMVRSYARLLGLDAGALLEALKESVAAPDADQIVARYREQVPFSDTTKRSNAVYVVFTIAVLAVAALVLVQWRADRPAPARMTFVPAAQAPLESAPTTVASAGASVAARAGDDAAMDRRPATDSAPLAPASSTAETAAASGSEMTSAEARVETTEVAVAAPYRSVVVPVVPVVTSAADSKNRVQLQFLQDAWVEVRDRDGVVLHSKLNTAGSDVRIEGDGPFSFVIGNAQFVRLTYDDRDVDLTPYIKVAVARFTLQ